MAPSGSDWADKPGLAAQSIVNKNERELLRRIWLEADAKPTAFVAIDTEYTLQGVCELGIATRKKDTDTVARHFIVSSSRRLRQRKPKPFGFGKSEEVPEESDLRRILNATLAGLQLSHEVVVLTGHHVQVELSNLKKHCGWEAPNQVIILDTLHIWRAWINVPERGSLEQALEFFALLDPRAHLHNAGNDAKYTMELLVRKAIQAVESPVPWDRTDTEIRDKNLASELCLGRQLEPNAPSLGSVLGKKRKREAGPASESSQNAPSPAHLAAWEKGTQGICRKRAPRWVRKMRAAARELLPAAPPVQGSATNANGGEIIDLTGSPPPQQEPAAACDDLIDLTGDTPPPESAERQKKSCEINSHNCGCQGTRNCRHDLESVQPKHYSQDGQQLGLVKGQSTGLGAAASAAGLATVFLTPGLSTNGLESMRSEWHQEMDDKTSHTSDKLPAGSTADAYTIGSHPPAPFGLAKETHAFKPGQHMPKASLWSGQKAVGPGQASSGRAVTGLTGLFAHRRTHAGGPLSRKWCDKIMNMVRETGVRPVPEPTERRFPACGGHADGSRVSEDKQQTDPSRGQEAVVPADADNQATAMTLDGHPSDANGSVTVQDD